MDFSRQCKRLFNNQIINHEQFKRNLGSISAIALLKVGQKISNNSFLTSYRIILADNEEKSLLIINESDGKIVKEIRNVGIVTYGICCTNKKNDNQIYVCDYEKNTVRKFDENLNEKNQLKLNSKGVLPFNGPCSIAINEDLNLIQVIDQNNCRVLNFDLKTDEYVSEFKLFEEDLINNNNNKKFQTDLTNLKSNNNPENFMKLDFKPFGICTKNERIYITDWNRALIYVYKNGKLERKIGSSKFFSRPRDIILDSLDFMLVTDLDKEIFYILDNKGNYLFETRAPIKSKNEKGIFGILKLENKLIFATNSSIYISTLFISSNQYIHIYPCSSARHKQLSKIGKSLANDF